ncbi:sialidase family protein [Streptomyces acidicola]|uniref:sialidase family protein n=1 Tax=Streptomyces acidicola TaxID=2596892 RepID=UPI00381B1D37
MRLLRSLAAAMGAAAVAALALATGPAAAASAGSTQLSGMTPFTDCPPDSTQYTLNSETEPFVAANPADPDNLAVIWQQDRHAWGSSRGIVISVSEDGGRTWERKPLPGFSPCADTIGRVTNPHIVFGPDGTLHASVTMIGDRASVWTTSSQDGGTTWGTPVALADDTREVIHDKQAVTVDPRDPDRLYAVWNRRTMAEDKHDLLLATSDDGGATWESPRSVYRPATTAGTVGAQVLVQRDGSLLCVFFESDHPIGGVATPPLPEQIRAIRSTDGGRTWSGPVTVADITLNVPRFPGTSNQFMAPGIVPDVALDPITGTVYAVWGDAGLSASGSAVGMSASYDGGRTWTTPRKVNATPDSEAGGTGQAFLPQVDVHRNGTVAVTYYDFRGSTPGAGTVTDHWMLTCRGWTCPLNGRNWSERRLAGPMTGLEGVSMSFGAPFVGTYVGLSHDDESFLSAYVAPTGTPEDPQNVQLATTPAVPRLP